MSTQIVNSLSSLTPYITSELNVGDIFYLCGTYWQSNYEHWPLSGDINMHYFRGAISSKLSNKHNTQGMWYKVKWETDDRVQQQPVQYPQFFQSVIWDEKELPSGAQIIDKDTWIKCTATFQIQSDENSKFIYHNNFNHNLTYCIPCFSLGLSHVNTRRTQATTTTDSTDLHKPYRTDKTRARASIDRTATDS